MSFIDTIAPSEARDNVAQIYRQAQAEWGYVPRYARAFSHRPALMQRWGALLAEIKRPMDLRRLELVTFVAAHALRNSPCSLAHGRRLREHFTDVQIVALSEERYEQVLSAAESDLARFARAVAVDASRIQAWHVEGLKASGYSDAEIFDVAAVAAGRAFFTKMLDALGVRPDAPLAELPSPLREALLVGRPVAEGPCPTLPEVPAPSAAVAT